MPQRLAAKRYVRKSKTNRQRNLAIVAELKNTLKKFKKALAAKNSVESKAALSEVYKKLDKAAKKKVIHVNTAARKKSRLSLALNKIKA